MVAAALSACQAPPAARKISVQSLETATATPLRNVNQRVVSDLAALENLYQPLGPQLGLLQVHDSREWECLRRVVPGLGAEPDFSRGMVIGLVSRAGLPVDGRWPIDLDAVRLRDGAGLLEGHFHEGVYLPDGTAFLEAVYVEGLRAVLIVNVDGARFYPNPQ